jgi:hypothetical protein
VRRFDLFKTGIPETLGRRILVAFSVCKLREI